MSDVKIVIQNGSVKIEPEQADPIEVLSVLIEAQGKLTDMVQTLAGSAAGLTGLGAELAKLC